jgi:ABC-2 type transport system ATP-binding protein
MTTTSSTHDLVIETEELGKQYGNVAAVRSLNLAVPRHSIFGFLGPNGAGKTTTMKMLVGLIHPTVGRGHIFGHDIATESLAIRRRVGYLPQQPHFYETMTARETLRFTAGLFYAGPANAIDDRVNETLALVGLSDRADRTVKGFSGGERQRLGIGQAQINEPDLLILDEPAAALDPIGRRDVLAIMERLRERSTIFYSTHILDDVQQVSDTVAIMKGGELVSQGPIGQLLSGDGQTIYTVEIRGDGGPARAMLDEQPWVTHIQVAPTDGGTVWQVGVTDPDAAEAQLLRLLLAHPSVAVVSFNRRRLELEQVFIDLIEGGN